MYRRTYVFAYTLFFLFISRLIYDKIKQTTIFKKIFSKPNLFPIFAVLFMNPEKPNERKDAK